MTQGLVAINQESILVLQMIQIALTTKRRRRVRSKGSTRVQVKAQRRLSITTTTERGKTISRGNTRTMNLKTKRILAGLCKPSLVT